jgi:hypothetical protein
MSLACSARFKIVIIPAALPQVEDDSRRWRLRQNARAPAAADGPLRGLPVFTAGLSDYPSDVYSAARRVRHFPPAGAGTVITQQSTIDYLISAKGAASY